MNTIMDFSNLHFYYLNRFSSESNDSEVVNRTLIKELEDILSVTDMEAIGNKEPMDEKIAS